MSTHGFLGNLLVSKGLVDSTALGRALELQSQNRSTLGHALAALGYADEADVGRAVAEALHLEFVDGEPPPVVNEIARLLPEDVCRKQKVAPLDVQGKALRLAMADPLNMSVQQDAGFRSGRKIVAVVVTQTWLERHLDRVFEPAPPEPQTPYDMLRSVEPAGEVEATREYELVDPSTLAKDVQLPPIVRLVNLILSDAANAGASDVHVEPQDAFLQVRQRVDGMLREVLTIPSHLQEQTISRLKIISGMDIAERRKPQDGRCRLRFGGRRIDLRVSTLPTQFGEKVVIRLLNTDSAVLPLDQLGLSAAHLKQLRSFLARPQGMIVVTGPTGSGKTSTLYAAVNAIRSPTNNIITLEDPIEFQVPGVNQTQINPRAGVTFATGLRSVLRQDPNVILVGEIRDQETANIALEAAQTGHLLLSTLHTNDAPATITRLFDLGIQPFLVASSLVGIVAQRLVRRVCAACAAPQSPDEETVERIGGWARLPADAQWTAGRGCEKCDGTGLKGRVAIHEILEVTEDIRELISSRAPEHAIRKAARRAGMRMLIEDGIDKAGRGLTTLDEVLRVVAPGDVRELSSESPERETVADAPQAAAGSRRVLVVEDSDTIVAVVTYFLELEGFEVLVARDGAVGLDMAIREVPDVIVSDVNMPGMGGVAMVRALRQDPRTAGIGVLMLTAEGSVESETEGLAAGADDYVVKPVEPRRLAARVKALLARTR